jgi:hypothetical protein
MRTRRNSIVVVLSVIAMLLIALLALSIRTVSADLFNKYQATPAPTATLGAEILSPTAIPLDQPLTTQEQALAQALIIDANMATWDRPWTLATMITEPDRISIKAFKSRTEESAASGYNEWFAPEVELNAGAVWRIAITGSVQLRLLGPNPELTNKAYDGVTYVISQRTGQLLSVSAGLPKK